MANERGAWNFERWVPIATLVVSSLGFTFGLGVNWAKVTAQEAKQSAFENAVPMTYVRKDVYDANQRSMSESVDRLTGELSKLRELLDAERVRRGSDRIGRTFDR